MNWIEKLVDWWEWHTCNRKRITREEWVDAQERVHRAFLKLDRELPQYLRRHGRNAVYDHMDRQYNELWAIGTEMEWMTHPQNPHPARFKESRYEKPVPTPNLRRGNFAVVE